MLLKPRSSNTRSSASLISWIVQFIVILQCIATSYQISYPRNPHLSNALSDDVISNNITRLKNVEISSNNDFDDSESSPSSHRSSKKRWRPQTRRHSNKRSPPKRKYKGKRKGSNGMFSPWSRWPPCDINCKQSRDRFCLSPRKCGGVKQSEERNCPPNVCQPLTTSTLYGAATAPPQRNFGPIESYGPVPIAPTQSYGPIPAGLPLQGWSQNAAPQQWVQSSDDAPEYRIRRQRRRKTKRRPIIVEVEDADYRDSFEDYDDEDDEIDFPRRSRSNDDKLVLKVVKQGRQRGRFRNRSDNKEPIFLSSNITSFPNILTKDQGKSKKSSDSSYEEEDEYDSEQDETNFELKRKIQEKAVFEMPRKPEANYTKWSKWTKCSPKCTTRRFKKCTPRARGMCGQEIIREVAYCYTEGSFCEEWINTQLHQMNLQVEAKPVTKPIRPSKSQRADRRTESPSLNSVSQDFDGYGNAMNTNRNRWPEIDVKPKSFQCGFPSIRNKGKSFQLKILGGKISRRGQWPWQVVILNRFREAFCGGTLIAPNWIISAAHCVRKKLYVKLGEHNLQKDDGSEIELKIEMSIKHPKYDKKTVDNDIAMLKLPTTIERSHYIGFACLPERFQQLPVGHTCTIIGWGKRRHNDDSGTNILHEAQVPVISNEECKAVYYDYTITKNMFCAGHKRGRIDTCAGDSGGPLLCRDSQKTNKPWTIYGITSFGDGCGKKNKFGIYAKLTNYIDWVWSVINCNGYCKF